jgi:hypothetical protein
MKEIVKIEFQNGQITVSITGNLKPGCVLQQTMENTLIIDMEVDGQHLQGKISRRPR